MCAAWRSFIHLISMPPRFLWAFSTSHIRLIYSTCCGMDAHAHHTPMVWPKQLCVSPPFLTQQSAYADWHDSSPGHKIAICAHVRLFSPVLACKIVCIYSMRYPKPNCAHTPAQMSMGKQRHSERLDCESDHGTYLLDSKLSITNR